MKATVTFPRLEPGTSLHPEARQLAFATPKNSGGLRRRFAHYMVEGDGLQPVTEW